MDAAVIEKIGNFWEEWENCNEICDVSGWRAEWLLWVKCWSVFTMNSQWQFEMLRKPTDRVSIIRYKSNTRNWNGNESTKKISASFFFISFFGFIFFSSFQFEDAKREFFSFIII